MKKLIPILLGLLWASQAQAQNPQCPTRPPSDNSNACASTAFVQNAVSTGLIAPIVITGTSAALPVLTLNPLANSFGQGIKINQTVSGTGLAFYLNGIVILSDTANIGAGFGDGFVVQYNAGGVGFSGGREALKGYVSVTTATSGSSNNNFVGTVGLSEVLASLGGTSSTVLANTAGAFFGGHSFVRTGAGVTNLTNTSGMEFNNILAAGSSVFAKTLAQFAGTIGDVNSGSVIDTMTWFFGQTTGLPRYSHAVLIEDLNGLGDFPIKAGGDVMFVGSTFATYTIANGIDMHLVAITGNAWRSPGAALSGSAGWTLTGSANYAIDTVGSTYLQAIRLANGLNIVARNAANSGDAALLGYDSSNNLELGASIAGSIVTGSFVIPRVDNTWSVGSSTNRYTAFNGISADLGEIGVGTGSIVFRGTIGGTLTQTVQATAGTPTVTWGTSSGTPVVTATAPCVITAATGNLVCTFASSTLTSAHIFVGNGSNVATDVAMSGDISITNAGVTTLVSGSASNLNSGALLAARMPALTGDITTSVGTVATTLATVNANVGTFGNATQVAQITANAKGLTTAVANVTITPAIGSITGLGTGVAMALGINVGSAGAPIVSNGALGTPSSGTVTNLTGTANININGTVGATTPAAGVFTTAAVGIASQDAGAIFTVAGVGSTSGASGGWQMVPRTGSTHTWLWYSDAGKVRLFDEAAGAPGFTMDDTTFNATFSGPVILRGYTVGTLPTGVTGAMAYVTDADACTFLTTVVHTVGTTTCPVFYDGTTWKGG